MKLHYFSQDKADSDDMLLGMAKMQGYVPATCLLGGVVVMSEVQSGKDPCSGCNCDRQKCSGRPRKEGARLGPPVLEETVIAKSVLADHARKGFAAYDIQPKDAE